MTQAPPNPERCPWCGSDPLYIDYHDREWGVPSRDDRHLFEMLILEGAQAGLSWITILRKRERYRQVFDKAPDPTTVVRLYRLEVTTKSAAADAMTIGQAVPS